MPHLLLSTKLLNLFICSGFSQIKFVRVINYYSPHKIARSSIFDTDQTSVKTARDKNTTAEMRPSDSATLTILFLMLYTFCMATSGLSSLPISFPLSPAAINDARLAKIARFDICQPKIRTIKYQTINVADNDSISETNSDYFNHSLRINATFFVLKL